MNLLLVVLPSVFVRPPEKSEYRRGSEGVATVGEFAKSAILVASTSFKKTTS